jgi:glycogen(starch) synthase
MSSSGLKLLFIGPYPPPHGGISVHVWSACSLLRQRGFRCSVLNVEPRAPASEAYIKISSALGLARELVRHSWNDWAMHVHINGHNPKSWMIALAGGLAAQSGPRSLLTIHSGIAPRYLRETTGALRGLARLACLQFDRIVCVNQEIAGVVKSLGIPMHRLEVQPAFLPLPVPPVRIPVELQDWLGTHTPVLSTAVFFRPEYGFDLLVPALTALKKRYPALGCLVMGSGDDQLAAEMLVQREGLKESVRFLGDVDHEMCLALMSRSRVFVRPTLRDGDSISVREAVSLGVQVVASNVGTRPSEVMLFAPGNIEELIGQIERALETKPKSNGAGGQPDSVQRLLNLYS